MEEIRPRLQNSALPIILLAAVFQGWALYALHLAIEHHHWPATEPAWLISLYAVTLFIPLTLQLLSEYSRQASAWLILACLSLAFFYFGWHQGSAVIGLSEERRVQAEGIFPLAFVMLVLWLHALPFLQCRLRAGQWRVEYSLLFATAWRNALTLAEAALFTGLFWSLLFLWQTLFHSLGIDYFRELFIKPIFVYPVTSLAFGLALHLIGSVERFITVVLEQLLNVLKWLALVAGLILTLFTVTMVFKLPNLVFEGQRAIGASWLLWLVAVIVLLLNAAYRDGTVDRPYPHWIAFALRCAVPLTIVIALTAVYALIVRARSYGLTVERVWAFVVAGTVLAYSIGYAASAVGRGAWMQGMARVNVCVALTIILILALTLTPILSPYRLAASSQYRMAQEPPRTGDRPLVQANTPFEYLRFDAGQYGLRRLRSLAELQNHPRAADIRNTAAQLLAKKNRWDRTVNEDQMDALLPKLVIYPTGANLDASLKAVLRATLREPAQGFIYRTPVDEVWAGLYVDLNGDRQNEFVLLTPYKSLVYGKAEQWRLVGELAGINATNWKNVLRDLGAGEVSAQVPAWNELRIGGSKYRLVER